ncbi:MULTISPECIES: SpoIIE family protein phosphatase [unclassified Sedimentibacter]|uniref:SpoIIE family protein phosphatase n=1 Tax=unclassified Sedimentibacter TaxID=2649220 RepID=UPI0027DF4244|nr:SpoIIE family protein phosphatase [Sedimentibacter sp. MB35-C1]WMJ77458.1 SpoIIE family protein phosphatase [Sedimentibacter sp. MB35-C1]
MTEKNFNTLEINETIAYMIDDHFLVCSLDGRIIFSNRAMQSYLGYTDNELKQKKFLDIVADFQINKTKSFIADTTEKPSEPEELLLKGKQGHIKLHVRTFKKNNYIYIYGNEKYAEYEKIRKKLDVEIANAIKIHKQSLPESLPSSENISFASLYIPAQELGGDLFDVFKVDNGLLNDYFEQYVCFAADVSGHGLDSAMLAIFVKDTIRSYFTLKHIPGQVLSPKEIMEFFVEQYMNEGYPVEYLVCIFLSVFDLRTNELTYCNAGFHMCPVLIRNNGYVTELNKASLPVSTAIGTDLYKYADQSLPLSPEMTLFIMSDGLPEQRSNNEFYETRLKKLFTEIYKLKPDDIVKKVHKDFNDFLKLEKINDDITLVVVKLS